MLDAYDEIGPKLQPIESPRPVIVLGIPDDGRERTATRKSLDGFTSHSSWAAGGDARDVAWSATGGNWQGLGRLDLAIPAAQTSRYSRQPDWDLFICPSIFRKLRGCLIRDQIGKRPLPPWS